MKIGLLLFLFLVNHPAYSQNKGDLRLWYNSPSGLTWENALPVGNGQLGAMIYGNVKEEIIQLNESTIWTGGPNRNDNPDASAALPEIRQLIFNQQRKKAEELINHALISKTSQGQMYQPFGNLTLAFAGQDNYTNYYRELDIEKAVTRTIYTTGGITYTREGFASFPDRLIVLRLTADKHNALSFTASFNTPQPNASISTNKTDELIISGKTGSHEGVEGKVRFEGIIRIKTEGGQIFATDTNIIVKNADTATIYISIATNFKRYDDISGDERGKAAAYLAKVWKNHTARC